MSDFEGLDLQSVEDQMTSDEETAGSDQVVLGVLDGTTDSDEWVAQIESGNVLVLNIDGNLNDLASGFAGPVKAAGGDLMHFRGFLIVTPAAVTIDTERLS